MALHAALFVGKRAKAENLVHIVLAGSTSLDEAGVEAGLGSWVKLGKPNGSLSGLVSPFPGDVEAEGLESSLWQQMLCSVGVVGFFRVEASIGLRGYRLQGAESLAASMPFGVRSDVSQSLRGSDGTRQPGNWSIRAAKPVVGILVRKPPARFPDRVS